MLGQPTGTTKSSPAASPADDTPKLASGGEINAQLQAETDRFQLVIEALKLNGIETIFGLPGIPITDLTRRMRKPGVCLTVSAPGFLNGLTALANATTNCFPMILISGSSEREVVDLQQGDYEEMDQL